MLVGYFSAPDSHKNYMKLLFSILLIFSLGVLFVVAQTKPRARDLGIPFDGNTGQFDAITDVKGVEVGYTTLISGEGKQAIRTGVTAILPQGKVSKGAFLPRGLRLMEMAR